MSAANFLIDVSAKVDELDRQSLKLSAREYCDELHRRVGRISKAFNESDHLDMRRQLVTLLAQGQRMARDFGLQSEADAIEQDDDCQATRKKGH